MLVTGTCIGAGMLGLPIATAAAGFYPSLIAFIGCWLMMLASALLMLEVSLKYPQDANLITMAKSTLGKGGEACAWISYVSFLYALMAAYTSGANGYIEQGLAYVGIPSVWGISMVIFSFALIVYLGAKYVDWANRLLMIGLIVAYLGLVAGVLPRVNYAFAEGEPKFLWGSGSLLVTSFGFHLLIPSLKNYLHGDVKALRWAIFLGSLTSLIVYLIWEILVLSVIPAQGENGLIAMQQAEQQGGQQAVIQLTLSLSEMITHMKIGLLASVFAFCAIITSFIGVALGLFDFLADGLRIKRTFSGKMVLAFLTFLPPVLIAAFYPHFMVALHYAGIFAAILLVIYPALMAWRGRYRLKMAAPYQVAGGKSLIWLTLLFGIGVIGLEVLNRFALLPRV